MAPKDDAETAALKKELTDLIDKFKVFITKSIEINSNKANVNFFVI